MMRIARFRSPELALMTALWVAHPALAAPAMAAEAAAQQAPQPPQHRSSLRLQRPSLRCRRSLRRG
jgi:invasion protein IalB